MNRETPPRHLWDRLGRAFVRRFSKLDETAIWAYHRVHPSAETHNAFGLKVSPRLFEEQVQHALQTATPVFLDQLMESGWPKQKGLRRVAFTFDDGYADNYTYAYPIMKKYGVPFTIFLNSDWIGSTERRLCDRLQRCVECGGLSSKEMVETAWRIHHLNGEELQDLLVKCYKYPLHEESDHVEHADMALNLDQIAEMQDSGLVHFEAHGHAHLSYGRLGLTNVEEDLQENLLRIKYWTGRDPVGLAYPYGQGGDVPQGMNTLLEKLNFRWAMLASGGQNGPYTHPYRINRQNPQVDQGP